MFLQTSFVKDNANAKLLGEQPRPAKYSQP